MQELLKVAAQLRRDIQVAGEKNPGTLAELVKAAEAFEKEAQRIQQSLQQWRQGIQ